VSGKQVFGLHAVRAAVEEGQAETLWLDAARKDQRLRALARTAEEAGCAPRWVSRRELDRMSGGARHQGAVAAIHGAAPRNETFLENLLTELPHPPLLLVLDGVQDPHNLGAALRSADGAGADAVIVPRDRACGLTPTVRKVASGAAENVPLVQVTNLARTLRTLHHAGIRLIGTAGEADAVLYDTDLRGPLALLLGAEERGLRRLTREQCDLLIRIPMQGRVESLNVSAAAAICLFEAVRQRTGGCAIP